LCGERRGEELEERVGRGDDWEYCKIMGKGGMGGEKDETV
jgi:hypothetical protein